MMLLLHPSGEGERGQPGLEEKAAGRLRGGYGGGARRVHPRTDAHEIAAGGGGEALWETDRTFWDDEVPPIVDRPHEPPLARLSPRTPLKLSAPRCLMPNLPPRTDCRGQSLKSLLSHGNL